MEDREKCSLDLFTGENIRKILLENPKLPLVFAANVDDFSGEYSCEYASKAYAEIGEILDVSGLLKEEDYRVFTDRDEFEEELYDQMRLNADDDTPQTELDEELKRRIAEYEPYWKKCILVTVGN